MRILSTVTAASFALSLLSAVLADAFLDARVSVLGAFAGLQYSRNAGIAFGMKLPGGLQKALIIAALIAVAVMAVRTARRGLPASRLQLPALGLILGGGLANVVDRFRDGVVTDYFQVGGFPIFNVADACVTVGVFLLLLGSLRSGRENA